MWLRILRMTALILSLSALLAARASALGFILGQTKEELKLEYDVTVTEHGFGGASTGRVTIVFTLTDEGRLKPLDNVELYIPGKEAEKGGGHFMDLVVSLDMRKVEGGKRAARIHLRNEWAERAQIWLTTTTKDGKKQLDRVSHIIPLEKYVNAAKPPATQPTPAASAKSAASPPPAAKERKSK